MLHLTAVRAPALSLIQSGSKMNSSLAASLMTISSEADVETMSFLVENLEMISSLAAVAMI